MEVDTVEVDNGHSSHEEEEEEEEELPDLDDFPCPLKMAATTLRNIKKEMDVSEISSDKDGFGVEDHEKSQPAVVTIDEDSVQCLGTQSQDLVIVEEKLNKNPASDPLFESDDTDAELAQYLDDFEKKEASPKPAVNQEKPKVNARLNRLMGKIPPALLNRKPVIKSSDKPMIDLEEDPNTYKQAKKGVEQLMKRFQIHTYTAKPKKEEHFKIHITTKEEDSQGIEQLHTGEEDYVKVVPDEEVEEITSPGLQDPGVKMRMVRARLQAQIRANRAKAMAQKNKEYAMYSEEKDLEDKIENEERDLLDEKDDCDAVSDSDSEDANEDEGDEVDGEAEEVEGEGCGEEEEDDEEVDDGDVLPAPSGKKERKRIKFLEDEADESDNGIGSDDEDEAKLDKVRKSDLNFIDDTPLSDDDDRPNAYVHDEPSESQLQEYENHQTVSESDDAFSQDMFSEMASQNQTQSGSSAVESSPIPNSLSSFLDPNKTPVFNPSVLHRKHSNSPFGPFKLNLKSSQPQISPLIPRLNSETALAVYLEDSPVDSRPSPAMPPGLSKLIGDTTPMTQRGIDDELEGICSARFPSQPPMTPCDSQENASFDFNSDDEKDNSEKDRCSSRNASMLNNSSVILDTPKTTERSGRGVRLNFDQVPSTGIATADDQETGADEDNDEEVVTPSVRKRKRKRQLKFSDDEDSDADDKDEVESVSDDETADVTEGEEEMQSDVEYDENEEPVAKPAQGLVDKKTGKLRREFFEAEAELSGSEAGSDDEDEKNMDFYEKEEGDDEDFDDEELRKQVEKQFLKQQLDDDEREVRDLQNRYLEDGDLHMDGQSRERKFKWKLENKQWLQGVQATEAGATDDVEDETEVKWREEKLEKLKWLKEHEEKILAEEDVEETSQKLLETSQLFKLGGKTLRKSKTEVTISEVSTSVVIQKSPATFERKGSFLCRETTLSRLAETAKISESINTTKSAGAKFVFQVLTPPNDVANSKKATARNKQDTKQTKGQPKKILRVDRSFDNLDEAQRSKSIFKFMS